MLLCLCTKKVQNYTPHDASGADDQQDIHYVLLIFSVIIPEDSCNFDCTVQFIEVKINKRVTNSQRCPFVRVYFLWKGDPCMSKVYRHGR